MSHKCTITTLAQVRQEPDLWYRIRVLLYDLSNVGSDFQSEKRLSSTTNELYISGPYFSESEATIIRAALNDRDATETCNSDDSSAQLVDVTVEESVHQGLANFLDKRKASGDARPCGPHDMVPVYCDVFGIGKANLKDERFLSRLRRSGLRDSSAGKESVAGSAGGVSSKGHKKKGKKGK